MYWVLTCPPEHGVVEERELHLGVMLQRGPASRCRYVDVGHVERNLHRQEGLSRVPNLEEQQHALMSALHLHNVVVNLIVLSVSRILKKSVSRGF